MKIRMFHDVFHVKLSIWFKLEYIKIVLLTKRSLRCKKRILNYILQLWPVIFCLVIYVLLAYTVNGEKDFLKTMWQEKSVIFTCLILALSNNLVQGEKKRKSILIKKHALYVDMMRLYENEILKICKYMGYEHGEDMIFYTSKRWKRIDVAVRNFINNENFSNMLMQNYNNILKEFEYLEYITRDLSRDILEYKLEKDKLMFDIDMVLNIIMNSKNKLQEIHYDVSEGRNIEECDIWRFVELYALMIMYIGCFVDSLRSVWRKDINLTIKAYKLLSIENEDKIYNHYRSKILE
ncbi:hypothetical protein [Clostridium cibarium]|uniref:Uncharacterized protein n=1 Tax=Clostridium cibarium TaxID=2762247 RepID=A0ABR8PWD8_9CLOT|nr:hypothetical protein [Clostridium cibarium]MBD7912466.1 hypothetical protein [Clostridium cibarium]